MSELSEAVAKALPSKPKPLPEITDGGVDTVHIAYATLESYEARTSADVEALAKIKRAFTTSIQHEIHHVARKHPWTVVVQFEPLSPEPGTR